MPKPLRIALYLVALAAVVLAPLAASSDLLPPTAHRWIVYALSALIALREAIPALYNRIVAAPDVEPVKVADTIAKVGILLALLSSPALASPLTPGVALEPPASEAAAPSARPFDPCALGLTGIYRDPACVERLLAQADAPPAPLVVPSKPDPALAPLPAVPPAAVDPTKPIEAASVDPCAACAKRTADAAAKSGWPTWATVALGLVGAGLATLDGLQRAGVIGK